MSTIEQQIKSKIQAVGLPLKEWEIDIYRGVLTGYNEAFIIDRKKKDQLINQDPKSAEIIRPILRGRDIKRYSYSFDDNYIIATFPSLKLDIDKYPAIKKHLLSFGYDRLKQTGEPGARKKTGNQWYETQDAISYWDDFNRQKIIYPEITKFLNFYLDKSSYYVNNKCFILTGERLNFLCAFLNSSLFKYCYRDSFPELLGGSRELRKIFMDDIRVKLVSDQTELLFANLINQICALDNNSAEFKKIQLLIDNEIFALYNLNAEEIEQIGFIEIQ